MGDEVVIVGPDARSIHSAGGIDWRPGQANPLLLAGDETAAPAISAILESLPDRSRAHAFIEVPTCADRLAITVPDGCELTWLARGANPVGSALEPAVREWVAENTDVIHPALSATEQHIDDIDIETDLLRDSPRAAPNGHFYARLTGEAAATKPLRRSLLRETGTTANALLFWGIGG